MWGSFGKPTESLLYHGVDGKVFERLRARLSTYGVEVGETPHGRLSAFGVSGEYEWDVEEETLEIRIFDRPFLVPHHMVVGYFREAIEKAGGRAA
jgi:hypothetical protein